MFDRIAPIYDAMNTVMTAGLDARWRASAARACRLEPGQSAIDVACGTGGLTRALAAVVGPSGRVVGIDASGAMLRVARRRRASSASGRVEYVLGDALSLPAADDAFDAATIAFGLRNVADYECCVAELARVTRPGGRIVVLELATPERGLARVIASTWFERVVPTLGRLAGGGSAYGYLPASVRAYPEPRLVARLMAEAGLADVTWRRLRPGLVTLHVGRVA
ncbi:MAG: ubiquinone/menaquinone biosynthesis methyltransferase [Chloroflexi bacterium]|nr:ubiquinone/menaquinone biosynthesis methyltransferase [Chloroflexota bacterium]